MVSRKAIFPSHSRSIVNLITISHGLRPQFSGLIVIGTKGRFWKLGRLIALKTRSPAFARRPLRSSTLFKYNPGKGKESDPTDASANTSANASTDSRLTVGRQSADSWSTVGRQSADALTTLWTYNVQDASVVRRWRVGDLFGPYWTYAMLNIPFPDWTEVSSTENFHYNIKLRNILGRHLVFRVIRTQFPVLDHFHRQFRVSQPFQGALIRDFVDDSQLRYADEVPHHAACCTRESRCYWGCISSHLGLRAQHHSVDGFQQGHSGRPSQQLQGYLQLTVLY